METIKFKYWLILLLFASISKNVLAQNHEEIKEESFAYKLNQSTSIDLKNQYGDIEVKSWEKDSIKIEVTIQAQSDNREDLNELMRLVSINAKGTSTYIFVETVWTEESSLWKRGVMDLKRRYSSDKKLVIDYTVYMPNYCRVSMTNKFGNIYLEAHSGPLRVNLAHGDLIARKITDARKIEVKYGKILVKKLEQGLLELSYGDLIVDEASRITLTSKSSSVEFFKINKLSIESRNDDYRLENISDLRGQLTYTQLRVIKIDNLIDLNSNYGSIRLKQIQTGFHSIRLNSSNTDLDLEFSEGNTFNFSVESSGSKSVSFMKSAKFTLEDQESGTNYIKGYLINKEVKSNVDIVSKNAYISLY